MAKLHSKSVAKHLLDSFDIRHQNSPRATASLDEVIKAIEAAPSPPRKPYRLEDRPRREESYLAKSSEHLWYEYKGMLHAANALITEDMKGMQFATYLNSFLVHTRNLTGFFFAVDLANRQTKGFHVEDTDMVVEDYFQQLAPWNKPVDLRISDADLEDINKQLAHLTYDRPDGNLEKWKVKEIRNNLDGVFCQFVRYVPESRLHPVIKHLHNVRFKYGLSVSSQRL